MHFLKMKGIDDSIQEKKPHENGKIINENMLLHSYAEGYQEKLTRMIL